MSDYNHTFVEQTSHIDLTAFHNPSYTSNTMPDAQVERIEVGWPHTTVSVVGSPHTTVAYYCLPTSPQLWWGGGSVAQVMTWGAMSLGLGVAVLHVGEKTWRLRCHSSPTWPSCVDMEGCCAFPQRNSGYVIAPNVWSLNVISIVIMSA